MRKGGVAMLTIVGMAIMEFLAIMVVGQGTFQNLRFENIGQTQARLTVAAQGGMDDALLQEARNPLLRGNLPDLVINGITVQRVIAQDGLILVTTSHAVSGGQSVDLSRHCDTITSACTME